MASTHKGAGDTGKTPSMKVKKGDNVLVLAGKDKGAKGRVIAAYPKLQKVLVEGVGRVKKHTRISTSQRGAQQALLDHRASHGRTLLICGTF